MDAGSLFWRRLTGVPHRAKPVSFTLDAEKMIANWADRAPEDADIALGRSVAKRTSTAILYRQTVELDHNLASAAVRSSKRLILKNRSLSLASHSFTWPLN